MKSVGFSLDEFKKEFDECIGLVLMCISSTGHRIWTYFISMSVNDAKYKPIWRDWMKQK